MVLLIVEARRLEFSQDYVRILDTTLRDGEQMPGISLTPQQKLEIALALEDAGVDAIEAGYPAVSEGEFKAVREIARNVYKSEVIALARATKSDIDKAIEAEVPSVHLFIATSEIHMKYKLKMSPEEVLEKAVWAVDYAKSHGLTVEFSAEDSTRSDPRFLVKVFQAVVDTGASRIDIADTVGVATPSSMKKLVEYVSTEVKGSYIISVHCHDDFGMSVANSISAVEAGARQVHVTVLGVGERAGNAALEEVVTSLEFLLGFKTKVRLNAIPKLAELVSKHYKLVIPPNKAIVGANAFAHESGIHVHGVLVNPLTYEPLDPSLLGLQRKIVVGKHSGRHAIEHVLKNLGIEPKKEVVDAVLLEVKRFGDIGIRVTDDVLIEIVRKVVNGQGEVFEDSGDRRRWNRT
ncbi:MAG: 2-isopropylmalate synthase [Acidilobaceae archaeon]